MIEKKERILLVNKFYYPRGGDCIATLNLEKLLKSKGHEVAVFSMQHSQNIESPYNLYFPEEVSFSGNTKNKINAAKRIFGLGTLKTKFNQLLESFQPDIVHLHNVHSYLSPIVAKLAKQYGCKVFWTLHDYKLLCAASAFQRNEKICELCLHQGKKQILKTKCLKNSLQASILGYIESNYWSRKKIEKWVNGFICPSQFMAKKMITGNFNPNKMNILPNFIEKEKTDSFSNYKSEEKEKYYCFVGRISYEKGIENLLKVAQELPYSLKIAGKGPLFEKLQKQYASNKIIFMGHLSSPEVVDLIGKAAGSISPSICYDNNPLSVIESLCMGTPVIGSRIGGIPELITQDNGMLFDPFNKEELKNCIIELFESKAFNYTEIFQTATKQFSEDNYYLNLCNIYKQ